MTKTITILPPEIHQYFERDFLSNYGWKTPEQLNEYCQKYKKLSGRRKRKLDKILEFYKDLYGWQAAESSYRKAKTKEKEKRPIVPDLRIYYLKGSLGRVIRSSFSTSFNTK